MMMGSNELRKVTKPDFRKKILCRNYSHFFVSKLVVHRHYLEIASLDFVRNVINYSNYCEESCLKISGPEKNLVSRYGDLKDLGMPWQLLGKLQYVKLGTW